MKDGGRSSHWAPLPRQPRFPPPPAACRPSPFAAQVIKIEPLGGDPIRTWRELDVDGTSPWFRSVGRNKRSVALNLKSERARELVRQLAVDSDVLIENFKPGTMEKWGLGPDELKKANPGLVYTRISGYGQTGPLASKPGFASACEAFGGFRHVNGFADRPSVRPNLSMGDTLAGLHAALGATLALLGRERGRAAGGGRGMGDVVDVAIYEAVFNLMEGVVPEYDRKRVIRQPSGSSLTGIAPTNTYLCSDGKHVVVGGNGDSIFKRLMTAIGRPELGDDPRMADNLGRVTHSGELDQAIGAWTAKTPSRDVQAVLDAAGVPCGQIYSVEDMFNDDHYKAREMFERVRVPVRNRGTGATFPRGCRDRDAGSNSSQSVTRTLTCIRPYRACPTCVDASSHPRPHFPHVLRLTCHLTGAWR